jgi:hypothetical protein
MDYDLRNVQDRSLFNTYIGTNSVADGPLADLDADTQLDDPTVVRAVKITLVA